MQKRLRAILLDLDGTLINRDAALQAWLCHHAGITPEHPQIQADLMALDHADHASLTRLAQELHQLCPNLAKTPRLLAKRIRQELPSFIDPDDNILASLDRLTQAKLRLALITNGGPTQRAKLARANIDLNRFEVIQISSEFGQAKPHPAIFQATLKSLDLPAQATLMIGDSPAQDIAGASHLNIPTIWLSHNRSYPPNQPPPTITATDFPAATERLLATQAKPPTVRNKEPQCG